MKTQQLTLRPDQNLFIHTPMGLITVVRERNNPRRFSITVPPTCMAFKEREEGDKEDLMKKFPLVQSDEEGKLKPTFRLAIPVVNEQGEMIGMTEPTRFCLIEKSVEKDESNVQSVSEQTVADGEGTSNGG